MATPKAQPNQQAKSRKRAKARTRLFVVLCAGSFVMLICILLLLPVVFSGGGAGEPDKDSFIGVKSIVVTGNTRYEEQAILEESGISIGQSALSVNRRRVATHLKEVFPFMEEVAVHIDLKRTVTIEITEATVLGAAYADGNWVVVSDKGTGLMTMPVESERPLRYMYLKGVEVVGGEVGKPVLAENSLSVISTICASLKKEEITGVGMIDMSNRNNIRLNWKGQFTIALGNSTNLEHEIAAAAKAIPKILEKNGQTAAGTLDLTQYSDPTIESPAIIFTPATSS